MSNGCKKKLERPLTTLASHNIRTLDGVDRFNQDLQDLHYDDE